MTRREQHIGGELDRDHVEHVVLRQHAPPGAAPPHQHLEFLVQEPPPGEARHCCRSSPIPRSVNGATLATAQRPLAAKPVRSPRAGLRATRGSIGVVDVAMAAARGRAHEARDGVVRVAFEVCDRELQQQIGRARVGRAIAASMVAVEASARNAARFFRSVNMDSVSSGSRINTSSTASGSWISASRALTSGESGSHTRVARTGRSIGSSAHAPRAARADRARSWSGSSRQRSRPASRTGRGPAHSDARRSRRAPARRPARGLRASPATRPRARG